MSTQEAVVRFDIHYITAQQLSQLGVSQIAYVKPVIVNVWPLVRAKATPRNTPLVAVVATNGGGLSFVDVSNPRSPRRT